MRKVLVASIMVLLGTAVAYAGFGPLVQEVPFLDTAPAGAYQRFASDSNGALFTNLVGADVTGLRIEFSSPVASLAGYGVGASVVVSSNEAGVAVLTGSIPQYGTVGISWPLDESVIVKAEWLNGDAVAGAVDLHTPIAKMWGTLALSISFEQFLYLNLGVSLSAGMSSDPDGAPIAQYLWEWSDGVVQEGAAVTREWQLSIFPFFEESFGVTVTLTVRNAAGESSTLTHRFVNPVHVVFL